MEKVPVSVTLIDNSAIRGREKNFAIVTIALAPVLASWRESLFAYEWLHKDGSLKTPDEQSGSVREKRQAITEQIRKGAPLERPVLGIGILDTVEIGSGRDVLLTLAVHGLSQIEVHIPKSHAEELKPFIKNPGLDPTSPGTRLNYFLYPDRHRASFCIVLCRGHFDAEWHQQHDRSKSKIDGY